MPHEVTAEDVAATLAQICKDEGKFDELFALSIGNVELSNDATAEHGPATYLFVYIPVAVLKGLDQDQLCANLTHLAQKNTIWLPENQGGGNTVSSVIVLGSAARAAGDEWRLAHQSFLAGIGVTNQGRIGEGRAAPLAHDGLLFRSKVEINVYEALKSLGVVFAPLPTFVLSSGQRIEPDFVLYHSGQTIILEIDGPFHTETPAKAHERLRELTDRGCRSERVDAKDVNTAEKAKKFVQDLLRRLRPQ